MTVEEIERFIALVERQLLSEFTLSRDGVTLTLRNAAMPEIAEPAAARAVASPAAIIRAAAAGIFRAANSPDHGISSSPGDALEAGQIVAFLQIGPCLRPVVSPGAGTLGLALVRDGDLVGFGVPLFHLQ